MDGVRVIIVLPEFVAKSFEVMKIGRFFGY